MGGTLKRQLEAPSSPVRQFFDARLPFAEWAQPHIRAALAGATTISPDPALHPPMSLLGHAISIRIAWAFEPGSGFQLGGADLAPCVSWIEDDGLRDVLFVAASNPVSDLSPLDSAAVAWVAGVADQAYRSGIVDEAAVAPMAAARSLADLVEPAWAADILAVYGRCAPTIGDHLARGGRAPVLFNVSPIRAEGDYVTRDGLLVEIKSSTKPGFRSRDIRQLVSYALLDRDDTHRMQSVALLYARQGVIVEWASPTSSGAWPALTSTLPI